MENSQNKTKQQIIYPIMFGFFIMGFADLVGIATNYIKADFSLSDTVSNLIPMGLFLWFALCSILTGILMGKIGRRNTVLIAFTITVAAMLIPLFIYKYEYVLFSFMLLGIGNTILQVSLNPMVAYIVPSNRVTSVLTLGQFIKAVSSFLGPVIASAATIYWGNWKLTFLVFGVTTLLAGVWMLCTIPSREQKEESNTTFLSTLQLFKDSHIILLFLGILLIVGIDVGLNTSIPKIIMHKTGIPLSQAGLGVSVYFACRALGAFAGAFILAKIPSFKILACTMAAGIIILLAMILVYNPVSLFVLSGILGLMCANVFSIIYAKALQHAPDQGNEVSALLIMGVSGGALLPPIMGIISDHYGQEAGLSILFLCFLYLFILSYRIKN